MRSLQAALELEPDHANALYNYAVLLDASLRRRVEAEALYRQVLSLDSKHGYALYNLAVLLEERLKAARTSQGVAEGVAEVKSMYQRAAAAAPSDALSAADLGRFLLVWLKDYRGAEAIFL